MRMLFGNRFHNNNNYSYDPLGVVVFFCFRITGRLRVGYLSFFLQEARLPPQFLTLFF